MMMRTILNSLVLTFGLSAAHAAQDQVECVWSGIKLEQTAGTNVSKKALQILEGNYSSKHVKGLSDDEVIQRIQDRIAIYPTVRRGNPVRDSVLAGNIFRVAKAYGLDPFILTAKIEVESDFIVNVIDRNGTGISQMTTVAVEELTYQYQKKDVGGVYQKLSSRYFTEQAALDDWMRWARRGSDFNGKRLYLAANYKYALAAGASFLKFKLALNGGNYAKALASYNGGGTAGYSNNVSTLAQRIDQTCEIPAHVQKLVQISCALAGTQEACNDLGREILGLKKNGYEI